MREAEINRFNRLPAPEHYRAVAELLTAGDRAGFYRGYPFAVTPPTDDRPFFFHFFRWAQTPQVLATLGRTWQPFGGSGYLVLFALLVLVLALSGLLICCPWRSAAARRIPAKHPPRLLPARARPVRLLRPAGHRLSLRGDPADPALAAGVRARDLCVHRGGADAAAGVEPGQRLARSRGLPKRAAVAALALLAALTALAAGRWRGGAGLAGAAALAPAASSAWRPWPC